MRKQDYLVGLIAGLEPNERRYVKLFCGLQPGEKRYLKLFDALEHKTKYDSAELCAELGLEPWQLADDKHYLAQALLQSLRNYDQEATEVSLLRNSKENIHVLMHRRMFSYALDVLEKALKQAWKLETFEMIEELLMQRSSCWQNMGEYPEHDDTLELHKQAAEMSKEVVQMIALRCASRRLETSGASPENFSEIINHPLVKGGTKKLKTLKGKSLRFEVLSHYYAMCYDNANMKKLAIEERALYVSNPQAKIVVPIVYLTNLFRLASGEENLEKRQKIVEELQKELANPEIQISNPRRKSILWTSKIMSVWNMRHLHQFDKALQLVQSMENHLSDRSAYERFSFGFEYALISLHKGNASFTIDKIDELLRFKSDVRADLQQFVRLVYLMAHLDLGNYALIPHLIKSFRFWLKKNGGEHEEVSVFLKHVALIAKASTARNSAWQSLLADVEAKKLPRITELLQFDVWVKTMLKRSKRV